MVLIHVNLVSGTDGLSSISTSKSGDMTKIRRTADEMKAKLHGIAEVKRKKAYIIAKLNISS